MKSPQMVVEAVGKHTATVIFSHGLGDTAAGWYPFAQSLKRRFTHIKWVLPTAPTQPVTLNNGMPMPSWYDIRSLTPPGPGGPVQGDQDEAGMLKSVGRISELIRAEVDAGISADRIVVGGFSQGAVVGLLTGITSERKLAGMIALSGYLALSDKIHLMQTDHAKNTPIFWGHGTADQTVRFVWGKASADKLKGLGYSKLEFNSYERMAHSLCDEEQSDLEEWLKKTLPEV